MKERAERLREAFKYLKSNGVAFTQKDVAEKMGATPPNVSGAFNGNEKNLTDKFLMRFNASYGNIFNSQWLLKGEGEMVESSYDAEVSDEDAQGYWIPLVPIAVMAGDLANFDIEGVDARRCERFLSPIPGIDLALPVCGDSMSPEYPNGSRVLVKKINHEDFIIPGNVYAIDTTNGPLLKRVAKSDKEGYIKCISINEEAGYEPFDVPKRTIRAMYRVVMCIAIKG